MKIQAKGGICHPHTHTHIYNLIFVSRHKGCRFTPFIYLVRVELESMRVNTCPCALVYVTKHL